MERVDLILKGGTVSKRVKESEERIMGCRRNRRECHLIAAKQNLKITWMKLELFLQEKFSGHLNHG